jgi:hypothetical protein
MATAACAGRVNAPMYRGFEQILRGKRDPHDALVIVPRICGICSVSQSVAAARALADAGRRDGAAQRPHTTNLMPGHRERRRPPDALLPVLHARLRARRCTPAALACAEARRRFARRRGEQARAAVAARQRWFELHGHAGRQVAAHAEPPARRQRARGRSGRAAAPAGRVREFRAFLERQLFGAPLEAVAALRQRSRAAGAWAREARAATCGCSSDRRRPGLAAWAAARAAT